MELSLQDIHELLEGCKSNHRKAQQRFYEWLKVYAVNICYRYASNQQDLEELVSEGFIKVYKNIHLYDASLYGLSEASFKGWFKRVLINNCIDWIRKKHPPVSQFSELELVDRADKTADALDQLSYKEIIEAVRELSPMYRTVFNLFVIEGHTHEEIGSMLGISIGTSKSNLFKAREALRAILKKKINRQAYA